MDLLIDARGDTREFVYNPRKMKDLRRLYVNSADRAKIGNLDLVSGCVSGTRHWE